MKRSLADAAPSCPCSNPCSSSVSTLVGVAMAAAAHSTPSTSNIVRVPESWSTESR
jgi:hypothetical protein